MREDSGSPKANEEKEQKIIKVIKKDRSSNLGIILEQSNEENEINYSFKTPDEKAEYIKQSKFRQ